MQKSFARLFMVLMPVAAVAALVGLSACQKSSSPGMTDAERTQLETEAKQAIADRWVGFRDAILNKDFEGWASFWTANARLLEPGMDLSGSSLFDFVRELFQSGFVIFAFDLESFDIFVHGDVAYQIGKYDESFQPPEAEQVKSLNYFFARWVKQPDGVWKIDRFLAGPRNAPAED